jgi:hypothetical protein
MGSQQDVGRVQECVHNAMYQPKFLPDLTVLKWSGCGCATLIGCADYEAQQRREEERAGAQVRMADDVQCRSDGVEPGSPGYAQCRMT